MDNNLKPCVGGPLDGEMHQECPNGYCSAYDGMVWAHSIMVFAEACRAIATAYRERVELRKPMTEEEIERRAAAALRAEGWHPDGLAKPAIIHALRNFHTPLPPTRAEIAATLGVKEGALAEAVAQWEKAK